MTEQTCFATREVNSFEEYTLYSLEQSTTGLLRMMERSKTIASAWPGIFALTDAAGLCQELAALACFQDTLNDVLRLGEQPDPLGSQWREAQRKLHVLMDSLSDALDMNAPMASKQLFATELPTALNMFLDLIPVISQHIQETYLDVPDDPALAGIGGSV